MFVRSLVLRGYRLPLWVDGTGVSTTSIALISGTQHTSSLVANKKICSKHFLVTIYKQFLCAKSLLFHELLDTSKDIFFSIFCGCSNDFIRHVGIMFQVI